MGELFEQGGKLPSPHPSCFFLLRKKNDTLFCVVAGKPFFLSSKPPKAVGDRRSPGAKPYPANVTRSNENGAKPHLHAVAKPSARTARRTYEVTNCWAGRRRYDLVDPDLPLLMGLEGRENLSTKLPHPRWWGTTAEVPRGRLCLKVGKGARGGGNLLPPLLLSSEKTH